MNGIKIIIMAVLIACAAAFFISENALFYSDHMGTARAWTVAGLCEIMALMLAVGRGNESRSENLLRTATLVVIVAIIISAAALKTIHPLLNASRLSASDQAQAQSLQSEIARMDKDIDYFKKNNQRVNAAQNVRTRSALSAQLQAILGRSETSARAAARWGVIAILLLMRVVLQIGNLYLMHRVACALREDVENMPTPASLSAEPTERPKADLSRLPDGWKDAVLHVHPDAECIRNNGNYRVVAAGAVLAEHKNNMHAWRLARARLLEN